MLVLLLAFAATGLGLVVAGGRLGPRAFLVGALPAAAATAWVAAHLGRVVDGSGPSEHVGWVDGLDLAIDLRLDGPAAIMSLVVAAVGVAVLLYASRYFAADADDLGRLAGLLVLFGGSMLGLVQANHLLLLYVCWELTSVTSFLLIGNRHTEARARAAALHALLVTGAGGLALLGGLVIIGHEAGTYRIGELLRDPPPPGTAMTVAVVLVLVGAFTKSAQYPFHSWLPGAMAAPTPVSAYLHSATMVKAGLVLVARFAPMFAEADLWRPLTIVVGCATLLLGGLRALRQHDLKLLLAFGTVSQLGLMMVLFGAGTPESVAAGWVLLVAHAAFKATLFMVVGALDHQTGTRDVRELPGLGRRWRGVEVATVLAAGSMAGVPLGAGFVAKELAYDALAGADLAASAVVLGAIVAGSMLTVAYAARFYWGAFVVPRRRAAPDQAPVPPPHAALVAPALLLGLTGVALGVVPGVLDGLVDAALEGFGGAAKPVHLSLWHGVGLPLALSAVTLAGGAAIARSNRRVQPQLARGGVAPSGAEVYLGALQALGRASARITAVVQSGSLPVYLGVILTTAASLSAAALLVGTGLPGWPDAGSGPEALVAATLLAAALAAAVVRRRFAAAVLLGVVGYAMAGLFVLSGAPDLALTQVTIETLSTVVFVLVLRRLPERFERQSTPRRRALRLLISGLVGTTVFAFALIAAGHRVPSAVADEMLVRAVPDGHGKNVVNVILVDFRGFDTLGEITVLAVASLGAVALARVGRRAGGVPDLAPATDAEVRRLVFVDVSVRVIFHAVLMMSLWLLFAGHNQPGGGFVGGLLAGSAITLRYVAGGIGGVRGRSRFKPWTVLGSGVLLAALTALVPVLLGNPVLEVGLLSLDLPLLGAAKVSSALVFDTGVYVAVVGVVLMAFEAFGDAPVEAEASAGARS